MCFLQIVLPLFSFWHINFLKLAAKLTGKSLFLYLSLSLSFAFAFRDVCVSFCNDFVQRKVSFEFRKVFWIELNWSEVKWIESHLRQVKSKKSVFKRQKTKTLSNIFSQRLTRQHFKALSSEIWALNFVFVLFCLGCF